MKNWIPTAGSVLLTLLAVVIATVVSLHLWDYYMEAPWTRDGHVHADIVQVAPDVSGWSPNCGCATTSVSRVARCCS